LSKDVRCFFFLFFFDFVPYILHQLCLCGSHRSGFSLMLRLYVVAGIKTKDYTGDRFFI
jgi:hypothetical protein